MNQENEDFGPPYIIGVEVIPSATTGRTFAKVKEWVKKLCSMPEFAGLTFEIERDLLSKKPYVQLSGSVQTSASVSKLGKLLYGASTSASEFHTWSDPQDGGTGITFGPRDDAALASMAKAFGVGPDSYELSFEPDPIFEPEEDPDEMLMPSAEAPAEAPTGSSQLAWRDSDNEKEIAKLFPFRPTFDDIQDLYQKAQQMRSNKLMTLARQASQRAESMVAEQANQLVEFAKKKVRRKK